MKIKLILILFVLLFVSACQGETPLESTPDEVLPTPVVMVTSIPSPDGFVDRYLENFKSGDYAALYPMVDAQTRASMTAEEFAAKYQAAMDALTLVELTGEKGALVKADTTASVDLKLVYKTNLFGDFPRDFKLELIQEDNSWKVLWQDGLIFPDMAGGIRLSLDNTSPTRGFILDNQLEPLVTQTEVIALGIIPNQVNEDSEGVLISTLASLTGKYPGMIKALYDDKRGTDWYVPVGESSLEDINKQYGLLSSLGGVVMSQYTSRYYYENGIAPQSVGYVSPISQEQLTEYTRKGYLRSAVIGQLGVERWGEEILAGKPGGTLYLVDPEGRIVSSLGKAESEPSASIALTLDSALQKQAQLALAGFTGSVVVIERDTGRVLALASSPKYDPNLFDPKNANSGYALGDLMNDPSTPMLDRSVHGQYPLGSVFKVITFAAALESDTYTPETKYYCDYEFAELPDRTLYDWTWEHYQQELLEEGEGFTRPSGDLNLIGALMRSCNPYFWHIGLDLYNQGRVTAIANMARGFGLGSPTGIGVIEESSGTIQDPPTVLDAVNQSIGQGDVLVTPIQVANFMAAIGNGGTLYRPQLIEKIVSANGSSQQVFKPEVKSVLPMRPETLSALRTAMEAVVRNPRGTAYLRFTNVSLPVFGKTGTAESSSGKPHAWFAGYTNANNPDRPDIAIAVIVENGGEGSEYAAPIFKRIVESYFNGRPLSPYWWESNIGITRTPTPLVTETPTP